MIKLYMGTRHNSSSIDDSFLQRVLGSGKMQAIFSAIPVGICLTNKDGLFEYVNPTYCRMYGYTQEELIGQHFTTIVPEENRERLLDLHDRFMDQQYELRGEWRVQRKDGSLFDILADAAYIEIEDGEPFKATFVTDISERKLAEQQLETAVKQLNQQIEERQKLERTRDEVERIVRHDLRNPLNAMLIATQLLMSQDMTPKQKELLNIVHESGYKLNYMLSNSMDFVSMEEGKYRLTPRRLRVSDIFRTVMQETIPAREKKAVEVELLENGRPMSGDSSLLIDGERMHLENLFTNLLRNAIEASPEGAVVSLGVQEDADWLEFQVHNQGEVPEDIRDNFFDRYATTGKEEGTGLGTFIASLITKTHAGTISFVTDSQEGTTLTVRLPREQPGG